MNFRIVLPVVCATAIVAAACDGTPPVSPEMPAPVVAEDLGAGGAHWRMGGQNLSNTRHASNGVQINPGNVGSLAVKWVFQTGGDVSATPSVDGESVYFPDWGGNLFSLDRGTGAANWSRQVSEYTGVGGDFSRNTPAIHANMLILGGQGGRMLQGATLFAVDKSTGDLIWSTQLDAHPAAIVTQSPVVFGNKVYVGVASLEELLSVDPNYPCCSFRGSVVALDVKTGDVIWKTYTAPDIAGYSGNAVWGPTAALDPSSRTLFVTTGNNYTVPDDVLVCVTDNEGDPDAVAACIDPSNNFDAVMALDLDTGAPKWVSKALPFDAWTVACLFDPGSDNCSSPSGPDLDFGEGPALFSIPGVIPGMRRQVVGAGQKSGQYWVFDRNTGDVVWVTQAGPGGLLGGMIWGSAVDGDRIYTANANSGFQSWGLVGGNNVNSGFWSAMDAATGEILWQTPDPAGFVNQGPVAVANGVVFGCSLDVAGNMYAMDANSGQVLWGFASGGSCNAGAAIVGGDVYWGSGYASLGPFLGSTGNNQFYAFEVAN
jgi:polyvinyl alcohol dehydrogenase (cytochrome)